MDQVCCSFPSLEPLLAPGHILDGDEQRRLLSLLAASPGHPQLVAQQHLTPSEWRMLMALVEAYPGYASYASLLALLTSSDEQKCQQRLRTARTIGNDAIKQLLRPLRKILTSLHPKLNRVGLMVASVQGLGYLLVMFDEIVRR